MNRVAIVTGAARGIGAATVRGLAAEKWSVVALDRCADDPRLPYALATPEDMAGLLSDIGAGDRVTSVVADASDRAAMAQAVALAETRYGGLDAMIAAAGVIAGGVPMWELAPEQEQAVLEVDLHAVLTAARVAVPALLRRSPPRQGRFIAVASAAATRGMAMIAAYGAAKAGVLGLVRGLAAELRGTGVTANAVSPGSTRTQILEQSTRLYGLESSDAFAKQQPHERLLEPEEIAALIVWLAGPAASALTGAAVPVDGGLAL
jgi:SDR family mycofactocin-dependent oxidoreductase